MLQAMKSRAAKWVIRLLAVLLIISFAAWGVGDMITGRGVPTDVAEVGGTKITAREFGASFRNEVERLRRALGTEIDSEQARQFGTADAVLERLVAQRLLRLHADSSGILVGDDQIRQHIQDQPLFHGPAGGFDRVAFENALYRMGVSEQTYVQDLRSRLRLGHLTDAIGEAAAVPDALTDLLYRYANDRRVARYVEVPRPSRESVAVPDDGVLGEFHRTRPGLFMNPERRDLTIVHLSPERLAREIQPSEEQIRDAYDSRLAELSVAERRSVEQVVLDDEAEARAALQSLRSGKSVAEVGEAIAGMDADAVELGMVTRGDLPEEIADAAFALPVGTPSAPVRSPVGWHVLVVTKIEPGRTPSIAEVRETLRKDIAEEMAQDAVVKLANRLEDILAGGAALEEAAAELDTPVLRLIGLAADGTGPDGKTETRLPDSRRILATAFSAEEAQVGDLEETEAGGYFILRVDRMQETAPEPFDKARDSVAAAWVEERRSETARKRAERILERVRGGESLEAAAADARLAVATTPAFTRFDQGEKPALPAALVAELFGLKRGEAAAAASADGHVVAVLDDIRRAVPDDAETLTRLRRDLRASIAADLIAQYTSALRRLYPVSIDTAALDRLFDEGVVAR